MAPKGEDHTMASSPMEKKKDQNAMSSQKQLLNEHAVGNATDGDGGGDTIEVNEHRKSPQEIVGDRVGLLNLDWVGQRATDMINNFFALARDAEEHKYQELTAAIKIQDTLHSHNICSCVQCKEGPQSAWRSKATRIQLKRWNAHATQIQRWYRGHLHRAFAAEVRRRVDKFLRLIYFGKHAVRIQRHFRGFYSRKYKHDFYERKAYIADIVKIGTALRVDLRNKYIEQMEREQDEATKNVKDEIDNFIESSHFRVGTESCKGVFYSPLIAIFGRGRNYLEEHIRDARRRQVTGMELWKKAGFDEYGIPVKIANNKFFVKHSKVPHSKLSIDTRRRVEDAALITSMLGTCITTQNCGPYVTKWELLKKADKEKELLNPHKEDFNTSSAYVHVDYQHLKYPTVRQGSEWNQTERLRKEEQKQLEAKFPNMVENPFILNHPSGKVFDLPTVVYGKIFPKRHHHTHFPHSYGDRDHRINSMPMDQEIHDHNLERNHHPNEKVRFQSLLTNKRLSSMTINHRQGTHVS